MPRLSTILRRTAAAALVVATAALPVAAQNAQAITFAEAATIALERNVTLQQAENSLDAEAATVLQNKYQFVPNLSLSAGPNRRVGFTFDQTSFQVVSTASTSFSVGASAGVTVFDGFANVASLRQAQYGYEAAELAVDRTRNQVLFTTAQQFLQVLLDKELIRIREENVQLAQQQLEQIEEFVAVGRQAASDLAQQRAQVANAELLLLQAEQRLELSKTALVQTLQLDPVGVYTFIAPSIEGLTPTEQTYDLQGLLNQAFENRPELREQQYQIEAAEEGIRIAKSGYWPSVSLNANYGSSYSSLTSAPVIVDGQVVGSDNVVFFDQLDQNRGGAVGLSLSMPIFDQMRTKASTQRARVAYDNAQLALNQQRQTVALEVRQAYLDYVTATKQLQVADTQLEAAAIALEAAEERYQLGATTLVEVTQARVSYIQAANDRATAVFNALFQQQIIDYYVGTLSLSDRLFE